MLDVALDESRSWLTDCGYLAGEKMTEQQLVMLVHCNCEGGWPAFIEADPSMDKAVVWMLMVRRYGIKFANEVHP